MRHEVYDYAEIMVLSASGIVCFNIAKNFYARFHFVVGQLYPMHIIGYLSALCGLAYCIFRLIYWFVGAGPVLTCDVVLVMGGILQNMCIAFAMFHLFLRASAINSLNAKWKFYRLIGIFGTIIYIISFALYLSYRSVKLIPMIGVSRCILKLNPLLLQIKFIIQAVNHALQTALFLYPVIVELQKARNIDVSNILNQRFNSAVWLYNSLAVRATIGMILSVAYTISIAILIFTLYDNMSFRKLLFVLSILDMVFTISAIAYAIDVSVERNHIQVRRQSFVDYFKKSSNRTIVDPIPIEL